MSPNGLPSVLSKGVGGGGLSSPLGKESLSVNSFQKGHLPTWCFLILDFHPGDRVLIKMRAASQEDDSLQPAGGALPPIPFESFGVSIALNKL